MKKLLSAIFTPVPVYSIAAVASSICFSLYTSGIGSLFRSDDPYLVGFFIGAYVGFATLIFELPVIKSIKGIKRFIIEAIILLVLTTPIVLLSRTGQEGGLFEFLIYAAFGTWVLLGQIKHIKNSKLSITLLVFGLLHIINYFVIAYRYY